MTKVALITGGGTGIGASAAAMLSKAGWTVVVCGRREEPLRRVASAYGAIPMTVDLTVPAENARLITDVVAEHGTLDGLVLNAGLQHLGTFESLTEEQWNDIVATNLTSPFLMVKAALPWLLKSGAAVVTVASVAALRAPANMAAYAPSKAGVLMLAQQLAVDYGPRGIRSNVVCPGWTRTELADDEMSHIAAARGTDLDESYAFVTSFVPQRRAAYPDEVGSVIAFLMSDAASYVNGAVVTVDGGHVALDPGTIPFDPRVTISKDEG
jgi:meso-butanediol dehydrogenase/(S,S)-butanediol dehydrogenase/diacetyl reductase